MTEEKQKKFKTAMEEREERDARQAAFHAKLKAACPRIWRDPKEHGSWLVSPAIPEEWNDLLFNLSVDLEKVLESVEEVIPLTKMPHVLQCKEKFGSLRLYLSDYPEPVDDKLEDLIVAAEQQSSKICCSCGTTKTTQIRSHYPPPFEKHHFGWILPYCDDCFMDHAIKRAKGSGIKEMRKWHYEQMALRKASKKEETKDK